MSRTTGWCSPMGGCAGIRGGAGSSCPMDGRSACSEPVRTSPTAWSASRRCGRASTRRGGWPPRTPGCRAELEVQLEEVRASRARIVQAAYETRRRLERDLHDGAQQRLTMVEMTLRAAMRQTGEERGSGAVADPRAGGRGAERRRCGAALPGPRAASGAAHRSRPDARLGGPREPIAGARHASPRHHRPAGSVRRVGRILRRLRGADQRDEARARFSGGSHGGAGWLDAWCWRSATTAAAKPRSRPAADCAGFRIGLRRSMASCEWRARAGAERSFASSCRAGPDRASGARPAEPSPVGSVGAGV